MSIEDNSGVQSDISPVFKALCHQFRTRKDVIFDGSFTVAEDPLVTDKEHVQMVIREIWNVTGFRFTYVVAHE